jgi:hypothetical protein
VKTSPNGTTQWKRDFSTGSSFTFSQQGGLELDSSGNPVLAGTFQGTVDFDPSSKRRLITSAYASGFLVKLSSKGNLTWVSTMVGALSNNTVGNSNVFRIDIDRDNNIVVTGSYKGRVDFDPSSTTRNLPESDRDYVAKYNSNGQLTWAMSIPLPNTNVEFSPYALKTAPDGSIYVGGFMDVYNPPNYFPTYVDLNPGVGVNEHLVSAFNGFVLKLASNGSYVWSEVFNNTTGESRVDHLELDPWNRLHVVGGFYGNALDLDPTDLVTDPIPAVGDYYNQFVAKWRQI